MVPQTALAPEAASTSAHAPASCISDGLPVGAFYIGFFVGPRIAVAGWRRRVYAYIRCTMMSGAAGGRVRMCMCMWCMWGQPLEIYLSGRCQ